MDIFVTAGKTISVFPSTEPNAPILYLNTFSNEGQAVFKAAQALGCPPFTLVAVTGLDWNHDMAPWESPPAFKNAAPCTGGADAYLRLLTEEIVPMAEEELATASPQEALFILNTHTKKFHLPDCPSAAQIEEQNKAYTDVSRDELMSRGYTACKRCAA